MHGWRCVGRWLTPHQFTQLWHKDILEAMGKKLQQITDVGAQLTLFLYRQFSPQGAFCCSMDLRRTHVQPPASSLNVHGLLIRAINLSSNRRSCGFTVMYPLFDQFACLEHHNPVQDFHRGQAVGNDQRGALLHQAVQQFLNLAFTF